MGNGNGEQFILPPPEQADEGKTEMAIQPEGGKIVMRFREPRHWVVFEPSNAVEIGKHLIDCAVACGANVTIQVPRREISREKRDRLVTRAILVLRSMTEKGRQPAHIARNLVDTILSAID